MKKTQASKSWAMISVVVLAICFTSSCSSTHTTPTDFVQNQTATDNTGQIRSLLLRPAGWIGYWGKPLFKPPGDDSPNQTEYTFEARGDNIVVKADAIKGWYRIKSCERNVTISSNGIEWVNCHGNKNALRFDPDDNEYPFKGMNSWGDEIWIRAK